jgi:hypothetical protein
MAYDPSLFGANPYVAQQAQNLQATSNQNLSQNVMPGIGHGAVSAGQYGGSRQGIAEGIAAGNAQAGVNTAQANLYSNSYNIDQNNALQNRQLDNQYALTNQGQMQQFYTQNRQLDQSGATAGANLYNSGNTGNLAVGAGQTAVGNQYMNAPLTALQNYNSALSPFTGLGASTTTTGSTGGGAVGAVGGALAGAQIYNNLGFGSNNSGMTMSNGGGVSNLPSMYLTS